MSEPTLTGVAPADLLDPRLRDFLRDLPESQAELVRELIRERERLVALGLRRAEQLQLLEEVSSTLGRSLDRNDIERDLAGHAARIISCEGVVVARVAASGEPGIVTLHWKGGRERDVADAAPALDAVAEVARTGRTSRAVAAPGSGAAAARPVLAVPLRVGHVVAGVLAVYGEGPAAFGSEEEELLHTLGATAASALVNASHFAESLRDKRQAEALAEVARALGSSLKLTEVLRLSLRHSAAILGAEVATVAMRRGDYLHVVATTGGTAESLHGLYLPMSESASGRAMLEGRTLVQNAVPVEDTVHGRAHGMLVVEKTISAPMLTPDGPIGVLSVANRAADFTDEDARVLERLASQLALAVVNSRLYEEASEATRELSAAFDAIAGGMAVLDGDGFITRHNGRLAEFSGLGRGESLVGRSFFHALLREERLVGGDDPLGSAILRRVVGKGTLRQPWTGKVFELVCSPHPAGGAVVTVYDVTEEAARAAALERAEARYARLVESAEDAICTVDLDGKFTSVNRALERVMGRPRKVLLRTPFMELLPREERAEMARRLTATLAGKRQRMEMRFTGADGVSRTATVTAAPVYEQERVAGALAIIRDVTEERAILDQMVRREKLAALGELVGGVAHEVNSPLTSILAFGQILLQQHADDEQRRNAAETIVGEAKRAARIVGKLLTFARQNPAEKMRTDLNQVLRDTVELRRYPLKMQDIALSLDLAEDLPATWADPFQLQQVFINLLSNAEQALAGRPGERRITLRTERRGGELVASIADTGPGIAPEHLPSIFNPFYTTKPRGIGTGLGLSISFGIVREHGGAMRARSEPGEGAVFEVALPILAPSSAGSG
jgi:PAS domain S-box-containing protein